MHPHNTPTNDAALEAPKATEGQRLYCKWRVAKALWDLDVYGPETLGGDLDFDIETKHCKAENEALIAYLLHPAANLAELARKLRTAREEGVGDLDRACEVIAAIAKDASDLGLAETRLRRA